MTLRFKLKYKRPTSSLANDNLIIISSGTGNTVNDCINNVMTKTKIVTKGYKFYLLEILGDDSHEIKEV